MNELQELEKQYKELGDEIKRLKSQEKQKKKWTPKDGDTYYYLRSDGTVASATFYLNNKLSIGRRNIGNVFQKAQDALYASKKLYVEHQLRQDSSPFDPHKSNWHLAYDAVEDKVIAFNDWSYETGNLHFDNQSIALHVIDMVGEDMIKKYYFSIDG